MIPDGHSQQDEHAPNAVPNQTRRASKLHTFAFLNFSGFSPVLLKQVLTGADLVGDEVETGRIISAIAQHEEIAS